MDQTRRNTLKVIGATGAGIAIGGFAPIANAIAISDSPDTPDFNVDKFNARIEHTWGGLDANLVIKNTTGQSATIHQVSPSYLTAEPGIFDFSAITKNGPLTLAADEEIRIPFTRMGTSATIGHFDRSIQKRLRDTLTIKTEPHRIATISTTLNPTIV